MCGIAGYVTDTLNFDPGQVLNRMGNALLHRGPDSGATWTNPDARVGFSHRRLAILELSELGAQPMVSSSGKFTICYNGELYNAPKIRRELERDGVQFRGHSDTEVLLEAWALWGQNVLKKLHGMFAFAIYDHDARKVFLARDRAGEKPLYFHRTANSVSFASELKGLLPFPHFKRKLDQEALSLFFLKSFIPAPKTIFENTFKLAPGTYATIDVERPTSDVTIASYWKVTESTTELDLETALLEAVKSQMVADVPIGAFLSGGIDSSLIVALMASVGSKINTFTIGFESKLYDESPYARAVASHFGTNHFEMLLSEAEVLSAIPSLVGVYDEPFADASAIPTYLVSKLARKHVTVALSGDGGDELFGGYNRYIAWMKLKHFKSVPLPPRRLLASAMRSVPAGFYDRAFSGLVSQPSRKVQKLALAIAHRSINDYYTSVTTTWKQSPLRDPRFPVRQSFIRDEAEMMLEDFRTYLPDDVLVKVDRASMATSLETRAPFLDVNVMSAAFNLAPSEKIRRNVGKLPLRTMLAKYLPEHLINRPKSGFTIPLGEWLRTSLRDLTEAVVNDLDDELFDKPRILGLWQGHLSGAEAHTDELWTLITFQLWRNTFDKD